MDNHPPSHHIGLLGLFAANPKCIITSDAVMIGEKRHDLMSTLNKAFESINLMEEHRVKSQQGSTKSLDKIPAMQQTENIPQEQEDTASLDNSLRDENLMKPKRFPEILVCAPQGIIVEGSDNKEYLEEVSFISLTRVRFHNLTWKVCVLIQKIHRL